MQKEYLDPSSNELFDGTPFDAARLTAQQALEYLKGLIKSVEATKVQGLNAHMERNLLQGLPPDALTYSAQPEAEVLEEILRDLEQMERKLSLVQRAVSFDPSE